MKVFKDDNHSLNLTQKKQWCYLPPKWNLVTLIYMLSKCQVGTWIGLHRQTGSQCSLQDSDIIWDIQWIPRSAHASEFCTSWRFQVCFKAHWSSPSISWLRFEWLGAETPIQERAKLPHNMKLCKSSLGHGCTCSASRRENRLCTKLVWGSATPCGTKDVKVLELEAPCTQNDLVLPGFSWSLLFPIQTPTTSRHYEKPAVSLGSSGVLM